MRDFDEARIGRKDRDRAFRLHGEVFFVKPSVRPEALLDYDNLGDDATAAETVKVIDNLILSLVEDHDGAHERYRAIRADESDDAVTIGDLEELVQWLVEQVTGRTPTRPAQPSSAGPTTTGESSTVASASPAAVPG